MNAARDGMDRLVPWQEEMLRLIAPEANGCADPQVYFRSPSLLGGTEDRRPASGQQHPAYYLSSIW
jgi:hypothetical protein